MYVNCRAHTGVQTEVAWDVSPVGECLDNLFHVYDFSGRPFRCICIGGLIRGTTVFTQLTRPASIDEPGLIHRICFVDYSTESGSCTITLMKYNGKRVLDVRGHLPAGRDTFQIPPCGEFQPPIPDSIYRGACQIMKELKGENLRAFACGGSRLTTQELKIFGERKIRPRGKLLQELEGIIDIPPRASSVMIRK